MRGNCGAQEAPRVITTPLHDHGAVRGRVRDSRTWCPIRLLHHTSARECAVDAHAQRRDARREASQTTASTVPAMTRFQAPVPGPMDLS